MRTSLPKILLTLGLLVLGFAFVTPADAARGGTYVPPIVITPKDVTSQP